MDKAPRPLTEEWFKLLEARNPQQAMLARQTIKHTGTEQCCIMCGSTDEVADFMTDESLAVRICKDCKGIQESMYGGVFLPFPK